MLLFSTVAVGEEYGVFFVEERDDEFPIFGPFENPAVLGEITAPFRVGFLIANNNFSRLNNMFWRNFKPAYMHKEFFSRR